MQRSVHIGATLFFVVSLIVLLGVDSGEAQDIGEGEIIGVVFEDPDQNGPSFGDEPLVGATVLLTRPDTSTVSAVTDDMGRYSFTQLGGGVYNLAVDQSTLPGAMFATFDADGGADNSIQVELIPEDDPLPAQLIGPASSDFGLTRGTVVCVEMKVAVDAPATETAADFGLLLNGADQAVSPLSGPVDLGLYSQAGSCGSDTQPDAAEFSSAWAAFFVEPFQQFEIAQLPPEGAVSRSRLRTCEALSTVEVTFENAIVHTPSSPTFVNCTFANDVAIVCVQTLLFPGAVSAGHSVGQFAVSMTDEFASPVAGQTGISPSNGLSSDCFGLPGDPSGYTRLIAPLGEPFTLTQTLPSGAVGPVKSFCGSETTAQQSSTVVFAPNPQHDEPNTVFCLIASDVVTVCVHVDVGVKGIQAGVTASDFMATITDSVGQVIAGQQNVLFDGGAVRCDGFDAGLGEAGTIRFFAPPGETFTVTQSRVDDSIPAGSIGSWCGYFDLLQPSASASFTPNPASLELQARVTCVMLNGSVDVCVANQVGAVAASLGVQPDEYTIALNGATTAPITLNNAACDANDAAQFFVAPNSGSFAVAGVGDPRAALSRASCTTHDALSNVIGTSDGSSFDITSAVASVECSLVHESALVCVQNSVGPAAHGQLGASTSAYTTQLLASDGLALGEAHRVNGDLTQACPTDTSVAGAEVAMSAFMVGPGNYSLAQSGGSDSRVGLTTIGCSDGTTGPTPGTNAPAFVAVAGAPVNCLIFNDTLPVCMAKVLLDPATGESTSSLLGHSPLDWTLTLGSGSTSFSTPDASQYNCMSKISEKGDGVLIYVPMIPGSSLDLAESTTDPRIGPIGPGVCVVWNGPVDPITIGGLDVPPVPLPGDSAGCEITNSTVPIGLTKVVINEFGGALGSGDFELQIKDPQGEIIASGTDLDGQGITLFSAPFTSISITEQQQSGYLAVVSCTRTGPSGGTKASKVSLSADIALDGMDCTITNSDVPLIPVCAIKELDAGTSGFTHDDFTLLLQDADGLTVGSAVASEASDDTCAAIDGGVLVANVYADGTVYTIAEEAAASVGVRVEQVSASCATAGTPNDLGAVVELVAVDGGSASFAASPGMTSVTCIVVNQVVPVPVVITKQLGENIGDAAAEDFLLELRDASGAVVASGSGAILMSDIAAGTYSISESGPQDYEQTASGCNGVDGTSFTVDSSTVAIDCFIENSYRPPLPVVIDVVIQGGDATVDQVLIQITDEDGNVLAQGVDPSADLFDGFSVELPAGNYCVLVATLSGYELVEFTMTVGDPSNQLDAVSSAAKRGFSMTNDDGGAYGRAVFAPLTEPAVSVTKAVSDNDILTNQNVTWTLTATNVSLVDATKVLVTDELPEGLEIALPLPDGVTYNGATRLIRYNVGDLAAGESASASFDTKAEEPGVIVNTAFVSAEIDVTDTDNQSSVELIVRLKSNASPVNPPDDVSPSAPVPESPPLAVEPVVAVSQLEDSVLSGSLASSGSESMPIVLVALFMIGAGALCLAWDVRQGRRSA